MLECDFFTDEFGNPGSAGGPGMTITSYTCPFRQRHSVSHVCVCACVRVCVCAGGDELAE